MQPLKNCIGPTIRIGREIRCVPYAVFFKKVSCFFNIVSKWYPTDTAYIGCQAAIIACLGKERRPRQAEISPEFWIAPVNSGYYALQIYPRVYQNMFRVKPRVNLCLIFFTVLIQNSDKQWKVLSGCLKNLPSRIPSGHQTFPRGCAPRESLMTLGNSLGQIFPDNHCRLSTVCPILLINVIHGAQNIGPYDQVNYS